MSLKDRLNWTPDDVCELMVPFAVSTSDGKRLMEMATDKEREEWMDERLISSGKMPTFLRCAIVELDDMGDFDEFASVWVLFANAARYPIEARA